MEWTCFTQTIKILSLNIDPHTCKWCWNTIWECHSSGKNSEEEKKTVMVFSQCKTRQVKNHIINLQEWQTGLKISSSYHGYFCLNHYSSLIYIFHYSLFRPLWKSNYFPLLCLNNKCQQNCKSCSFQMSSMPDTKFHILEIKFHYRINFTFQPRF